MKNLNPIYLLEVKTDTILKSANKVRNALVKGGMSKKDATDKVAKRLWNINIKKADQLNNIVKLSKPYRKAVIKTPQYQRMIDNQSHNLNALDTFMR